MPVLTGSNDGDRQIAEILAVVLDNGLGAVEVACAEALGDGVHFADVVLAILARCRPAPTPIGIMTPDALKLRRELIADCTRHDDPRRGG